MDDGQLERDLAAASTARCGSTPARGPRTPPTRRTSGRCRSASCVPRTVDAAVAAVAVCREHGAPLLSRGGGTSLAGPVHQRGGRDRLVQVLPPARLGRRRARTCVVEPGIVLDVLNRQLEPHGLRFGPEPATHMNCTLGGMIGNNSCGATAQRTGKVVDNIAAPRGAALRRHPVLVRADHRRGVRRDRAPRRPPRRDLPPAAPAARHLRGPDPRPLTRTSRAGSPATTSTPCCRSTASTSPGCSVGSESTLVTVLRAELKLVAVLPERTLVVLGYPTSSTGRPTPSRHRAASTSRSPWRASTTA